MKKILYIFFVLSFLMLSYSLTSEAASTGQKGWVKSNGHWYYYANSNVKYKGWLKSGDSWFYLDQTGLMKTGWVKSGNKWYFLDGNGVVKTGWVKSGKNWFFLDANGVMKTGWVKSGNNWYYFNGNGVMQTGWLQDSDGKWYYLTSSGVMLHDTVINGYILDQNGVWITQEEAKFQKVVNTILSGANQQKTTMGKVLYIHNSVINMTDYDYGEHAGDPYGPLVYGKAVCEGYATTMNYLLLKLNIPSKLVWYDSGSNTIDNHAWNLVQVDGNWYHLDATWDDPQKYNFFLIPDKVIKQSSYHTHWDIYTFIDYNWRGYDGWNYNYQAPIPAATDDKFSYLRQMENESSSSTTDYENFYYVNNNDNRSIWEMSLDGTMNKKLLDGNFDNLIYLNNALYVLKTTYLEDSNYQIGIYKVSLDGKDVSEIKTFYVTGDYTWRYYLKDQSIYLELNDQINKIN